MRKNGGEIKNLKNFYSIKIKPIEIKTHKKTGQTYK